MTRFATKGARVTRIRSSLVSLCALLVWPALQVAHAETRLENGLFGGTVMWDGPPFSYFTDHAETQRILKSEIARIEKDPLLLEGILVFEWVVIVAADNAVRNGGLNENIFSFLTPEQTIQLAGQVDEIDDCMFILTTFDTGEDVAFLVASTEDLLARNKPDFVSGCITEGINATAASGREIP